VDTIDLELLFNRAMPFRCGWVAMLGAVAFLIASMATQSRACYVTGLGFYIASLVVQAFGFFVRVYISGRAPVSNMYETVIWVAFMSAVFALVLELVYRRRVIALAGALVATLGLTLADQMPLALDPKISPLVPVLRSNYWLTVHVLTIVSSYAGGSVAWALGNITLVMMTFGKGKRETLKTLSQFTYRALQIAVLLLAAGTFLGGWWAAESWGRFWGWDSKEVGALIALVCYVVPLHARFIGWVKDFGLAVSAVLCYASIIVSWYVVNFVIAAGLHSYGFGGGGGPWWVLWVALLNIEWVLVASMIHYSKAQAPAAATTTPVLESAGV
jgi:ABC-type transport system involved in cytochrome c biogenesis permease subunit